MSFNEDSVDYIGSAILGAIFSTAALWTLGKAFLIGVAGAAGGLFLKWLVKFIGRNLFK